MFGICGHEQFAGHMADGYYRVKHQQVATQGVATQ